MVAIMAQDPCAYPSASAVRQAARTVPSFRLAPGQLDRRGNQVEDYVQELHLRLWEAFQKPHESIGYLYRTLWNSASKLKYRRGNDRVRMARFVDRPDNRPDNGAHLPDFPDRITEDRVLYDGCGLYDLIPDQSPRPDEEAEVRSLIDRLESNLTSRDFAVLDAAQGDGTRAEQAARLGVSRAQLYIELSRTRQKVANLLQEEIHE